MRSIDGLTAVAAESPEAVTRFLNAAEITTFNQFISATRLDKTPVQLAVERLSKLTPAQREMAMEMAKKGDAVEGADTEE